MDGVGRVPGTAGAGGGDASADAAFTALLEDSERELYENAPCGHLSTLMDGTVAKINQTLLGWLGLTRDQVVGRMRFSDLLTVGGRLYHETHFAPLLRMRGEISGIALELRTAHGDRLPCLVTSVIKYGGADEPLLIRTTVFDARERRAYEEELLRGRQAAERAQRDAEEAQRQAEEAQRQAEQDRSRLKEALAALQQSLLPSTLPEVPGMEAASYYHTASPDRLGGDFYDLFPLDGKRWAFFLGDVCGKGPQAAAMTSLTRYTLRAAALHDPDPAVALTTLNTVLNERYSGGDPRYCTAIFGVLEPGDDGRTVTVRLASGGHPPALVIGGGRADPVPTTGGLLVGVLPDAHFAEAATTLEPGQTLLLYTDGLTEARIGPGRERFGDDALRDFAAGLTAASAGHVVTALTGLLEGFGDGLDDDTALLALGVPGSGAATDEDTP
ncbi:SpoIIE family protein phosphatase [Actinomadura fibrosa]|uniref:SpoIIE family protein phosphatase n=1 Tax=Actinomadura fibrosa TaxID=111802 RepID=A0ABW2Y1M8_9ACTN|nr:SpoIIE family protein phosphatase [Actinomadura fibrosa]